MLFVYSGSWRDAAASRNPIVAGDKMIEHFKEMAEQCWKRYLIAVEVDGNIKYWWDRYVYWTDKLATYQRFGIEV